ncbi:MAG TPA: L-threonylcarbamoyladenylate synthase [Bacteroidota bacterium]|jgi:tRNA threonylcarbamoyl adenosine modification protein (Sua5/YciO/YrdC/YwlC family)|nr:L-threonylcarbamoyladenylate synthase [Bacteroidota bacterium]
MLLKVHPKNPQRRHIARAIEVIRNGGVIIYPTDTVYGIGCSIFDNQAIERIYRIKQQDHKKPFSFICSDLSHISEYAKVSNSAYRMMKHLIPGPYTFILPAGRLKQLPKSLISKRKEVGIRVPDNLVCHELLRGVGHPILNAGVEDGDGNLINDVDAIYDRYKNHVDLMLDGGGSILTLSTILDLTDDRPVVVRHGAGDVSSVLVEGEA